MGGTNFDAAPASITGLSGRPVGRSRWPGFAACDRATAIIRGNYFPNPASGLDLLSVRVSVPVHSASLGMLDTFTLAFPMVKPRPAR